MSILKCEVENCVHNSCSCCELDQIAVKGRTAVKSDHTCCSTFCDCNNELKNENVDSAVPKTKIKCSADNCKYNSDCQYHASDVNVCGCGADHAVNTVCSTFECQ